MPSRADDLASIALTSIRVQSVTLHRLESSLNARPPGLSAQSSGLEKAEPQRHGELELDGDSSDPKRPKAVGLLRSEAVLVASPDAVLAGSQDLQLVISGFPGLSENPLWPLEVPTVEKVPHTRWVFRSGSHHAASVP